MSKDYWRGQNLTGSLKDKKHLHTWIGIPDMAKEYTKAEI